MTATIWELDGAIITDADGHPIECDVCPAKLAQYITITMSGSPNVNLDGSWTVAQSFYPSSQPWSSDYTTSIEWEEPPLTYYAELRLFYGGDPYILRIKMAWYLENVFVARESFYFCLESDNAIPLLCKASGTYQECDESGNLITVDPEGDIEITITNN
jgi:hypothetical protein